jgi:hypothetical protein
MTTMTKPYAEFKALEDAGWFRDFEPSVAGFCSIPVPGAPSLGGSAGGRLFAGCYTRSDGTSLFLRSNMDRGETSLMIGPDGRLHDFTVHRTLIDAGVYTAALLGL